MISVDKALLVIGILLIVSGSIIMIVQGIRINYSIEGITIPYYDFKYYGPGNYTETRYINLEFCRIQDLQVTPGNSTEVNCIDLETLNEKLKGYIQCNFSSDVRMLIYAYSLNNEPFNLRISLEGCRRGLCDSIIDFTAKSKPGVGVIEGEYAIKKLIIPYNVQVEQGLNLNYDFFKVVLESDEPASIRELRIFIPAMCGIVREIDYPMLKVDYRTEYYTITCINNIDATGLIIGFILNIIGLTTMICGVYLAYAKYSR